MGSPRDDILESTLRALYFHHQRPLLDHLLQQYRAIFNEPRGLPNAFLRPPDTLVARHSNFQKDELEQKCATELEHGIFFLKGTGEQHPHILRMKGLK